MSSSEPTLPLAGKSFWLDSQGGRITLDSLHRRIVALGGDIRPTLDAPVDYILLAETRRKQPAPCAPVAEAAQHGFAATELFYADAQQMLCPSRELALQILQDPTRRDYWREVQPLVDDPHKIDLRSADLGGLDLRGFFFIGCDLAGSQWVGTGLAGATFTQPQNLDLTGAGPATELVLDRPTNCVFDGIDAPQMRCPASLTRCRFHGANLCRANLMHAGLIACDFSGADLSDSDLRRVRAAGLVAPRADFRRAVLSQADLDNANLIEANFHDANLRHTSLNHANLTGANLRGADLIEANFTGATIDGADFTGARVRGAKFDGVALDRAIGLAEALETRPQAGPHLLALKNALQGVPIIELSFSIDAEKCGLCQCRIHCYSTHTTRMSFQDSKTTHHSSHSSWEGALLDLASDHPGAALRMDTVQVRRIRRPAEPRRLLGLALCELFGHPILDEKAMALARKAARADRATHLADLLVQLRQQDGVATWNARPLVERQQIRFDRADLSGASLPEIDLSRRSVADANLTDANLSGANLDHIVLRKANLTGANLSRARMRQATCTEASAEGINLSEARLNSSTWTGANLRGANFRAAQLRRATFFDADLTGAKLKDAVLGSTRYNAGTIFPEGYKPGKGWVFFGAGIPAGELPEQEVLDTETFINRLSEVAHESRIKHALNLLRGSRLELFTEVEAEHIVGVIRSNGHGKRLYGCRLTSEGAFVCGTNQLKTCSRQRGAVCSHLLALLVGLIRAGEFDAGRAMQWLQLAQKRTSVADRNSLAGAFLRYKGAEAGELDWRPTETVPEDYYAM